MTVNVKHSHPKTIIQNAAGAADSRWPTGVTASSSVVPQTLLVSAGVATNQAIGSPSVSIAGFSAEAGFTVTGTFADGQTLTITDTSARFGTKTNAKPYFWWKADDGVSDASAPPSSDGRITDWDVTIGSYGWTTSADYAPSGMTDPLPGNEMTSAIVATNSNKAYRFHLRDQRLSLGAIEAPDSQRIYIWAKRYDALSCPTDGARIYNMGSRTGNFEVGEIVVGDDNGYTGRIIGIGDQYFSERLFFDSSTDTDVGQGNTWNNGERIVGQTNSASCTMNETTGHANATVNYKTMSMFTAADGNIYLFESWIGNSDYKAGYGGGWHASASPQCKHRNIASHRWVTREHVYDYADGSAGNTTHISYMDGWEITDANFSPSIPVSYSGGWLRLGPQVSDGGQANAYTYHDSLYVDDSHHRILISDLGTYPSSGQAAEIQIPVTWTTSAITFKCRQGSHASLSGKSLFVVKDDGTVLDIGVFD
jgi:hypothetical protein